MCMGLHFTYYTIKIDETQQMVMRAITRLSIKLYFYLEIARIFVYTSRLGTHFFIIIFFLKPISVTQEQVLTH